MWKYIIMGVSVSVLLIVLIVMLFMCRNQAVKTIGPWKTGLSGQLQKAFITGNIMIVSDSNNCSIILFTKKHTNKPNKKEN